MGFDLLTVGAVFEPRMELRTDLGWKGTRALVARIL